MDWQELFNIAIGIIMGLIGWFMRGIDNDIQKLEKADNALHDKVTKIEVLVAGTYVKREEYREDMKALFDKLTAIENKLSGRRTGD